MDLSYFNPNSQKESDFLLGFVARQQTLEFFLRQLQLTEFEGPARHHLIIAPRGFGKTSLLRRIAIGVRTDEQLNSRFIALRFREEQHNVISLDVFWRNCLLSMAEAREDEDAPATEIEALYLAWERYAPRQLLPQEEQDGEPAWQALLSHCERLQRRPLLLIDNLDTLLQGLSSHHQWGLRKRLQSDDGPVLISAASRYPASTHDPDAAFYEFFRISPLERLDDQEVFSCLRNLAIHRGAAGQPVLTLLNTDPGRVAALNTLAGGNPRTLSVLYVVLESHTSADLLSQLNAMLDTFTGWYQARTEELATQTRAVFDALALNWDPMTAAALGLSTGLDTPVVSSQLARLEKNNYVERVSLSSSGKGRNGYQVSERFFNIWYLMRNGPRRAQTSIFFLTKFLKACFNPSERRSLGLNALKNSITDPGYTLAIASTLEKCQLREQLLDQAFTRSTETNTTAEYQSIIEELRSEDRQRPEMSNDQHGKRETEIKIRELDYIIEEFKDSKDLHQLHKIATALLNKGLILGESGQSEKAIVQFDSIVTRFGESTEPALRKLVASAMINKGLAQGRMERSDQAIKTYENLVSRFHDAPEPAIQKRVAMALVNKGVALSNFGEAQQAMEAYDDVITRFESSNELDLHQSVAMALVNKGVQLGEMGLSQQAIDVFDDTIARFGTATDSSLLLRVARSLISKGNVLTSLDRPQEAIDVFNDIIKRFNKAEQSDMQQRVAMAFINKGVALSKLGDSTQAIKVYDEFISRFGKTTTPSLLRSVAMALVNKGVGLGELGQHEQALKVYDSVVKRFGTASEPDLLQQVAMALINKGLRLGELGQQEAAVRVYEEVLDRFGNATEPTLLLRVARALVNKGAMLIDLGHAEQAIEAFDAILARFDATTDPTLLVQVALALVNKGSALENLNKSGESIEIYDKIFSRFSERKEKDIIRWTAMALIKKIALLLALGHIDAAESTYRKAIAWQPNLVEFYIGLGNLLLDIKGDADGAREIFLEGLRIATGDVDRAVLQANISYVLALYAEDGIGARQYATKALENEDNIPPSGRRLLEALPIWGERTTPDWASIFEKVSSAISMDDSALWASHADDLQRLLWFILSKNQGAHFKEWIEKNQFQSKYAPFYHAFVAALEGKDHLLQINPETRQPASDIFEGIARQIKLYGLGISHSAKKI